MARARNSDPDPICDHDRSIHRVTSVADGENSRDRYFRSAWVCGERVCTLDAQAWALRSGEPDVYTYAAPNHACQLCEPRP